VQEFKRTIDQAVAEWVQEHLPPEFKQPPQEEPQPQPKEKPKPKQPAPLSPQVITTLTQTLSQEPRLDPEKVSALLALAKANPELAKPKSPKELIIALKRAEFNKNKNKNKQIRDYYQLKPDQPLEDEQINNYLYLEATNQLQEQQSNNSSPSPSQN
jgi:hypothetical protein